ncbi:hypothetical protein ACIRYZ_18400 [Kitasatospora sp. NPDC101155]|uniref:hypothetical protein n=1 Tax=Kitasatospora sp. NPDC101155 TaxID=3364097 RepID=UPI00382F4354
MADARPRVRVSRVAYQSFALGVSLLRWPVASFAAALAARLMLFPNWPSSQD